MKIILVDAHKSNPVCTGHQLYSALTNMKHSVIHLDFRKDFNIVNQQILSHDNVDLLITWKGSSLNSNIIKNLKYKTCLYYPDDYLTLHGNRDYTYFHKSYDYIFTPIQENISILNHTFKTDFRFLPPAVDIDMFSFPVEEPNPYSHKYNFSFIGSRASIYTQRNLIVNRLCQSEDLTSNPKYYIGSAYGKDYINTIRDSKINVNVGLHNQGTQLRIFEVIASGGFLLTNRTEYMMDNFPDCVGTFSCNNYIEDVVNQYKFYLNHESLRKEMIHSARERVVKYHTWQKRFEEMFKVIGA